MGSDLAKRAAAIAAARLVENNMIVGMGTGTTARFFTEALATRMREENLTILGVPTSRPSQALAQQHGIPVVPLSAAHRPDITVDGADEVDSALNLIKGGGGALVQEKLVAVASRQMVVIADESKDVGVLGAFPLPVAVVPFGWETIRDRLVDRFQIETVLRPSAEGHGPFVTDDGLYVIDLHFGAIPDPAETEARLRAVVGVAEVGLFVAVASQVFFGSDDGSVRVVTRTATS